MKKIYIVTSGTYSDYSIEAIFSTEEKAEEYLLRMGDGGSDDRKIEIHNIDDVVYRDEYIYDVCIYKDKTYCSVVNDKYYSKDVDTVRYYNNLSGEFYYTFYIKTTDSERAKKIAQDRCFYVKANKYLFPNIENGVNYNFKTLKEQK